MTTFFTADTHFGHSAILGYTNRPFKTIEEMDETIVHNWNATVSNKDTVYLIGDLALSNDKSYLDGILYSLQGQIVLIKGNHDKPQLSRHPRFSGVVDYLEIRLQGHEITLCHYPMLVWRNSHYGSLMLHGHSHGTGEDTNQRMDVGMDCWGMQLTTLDRIRARMAASKPQSKHDHHVRKHNDFEV